MLELGCNLIDYEKVTDEKGRRLIFFGHHAGLAGMIDTLWALGRRLESEGIPSPFQTIRQTIDYENLLQAKQAITEAGKRITEDGLHPSLVPLICGITGYGNVSGGAQEIFDLLPFEEITPKAVSELFAKKNFAKNKLYKVIFREEDIVEPIAPGNIFQLQDYYTHPEKYRSVFERYVPYLTMLVNCIYWDNRYPRLITKKFLKLLYKSRPSFLQSIQEGRDKSEPRLRVIGDVSCDIEGSIEATVKTTSPDNPVFVYDPFTNRAIDGVIGKGPVIMAVDNLPCEIPREASIYFSRVLKPFIPAIAQVDFSVSFENCVLPPEIKKAVIAYQGELTPDYRYIAKYFRNDDNDRKEK
jgi:alpha-aminoadipic semialdehyde synthase